MEFWDISHRLARTLSLKSTDGALVAEVYRDSPADDAGIKPGDAILETDGVKIACVADMQDVLRRARVGDKLSLTLSRKGKTVRVTITLMELPQR